MEDIGIARDVPATCLDVAAGIAEAYPHVLAVAGGPITHLAELLGDLPGFEWAINEKSALETAVGLSAAGRRACVVMKHNGLCVALDSLVNAAAHTVGAGLLVVVGDDLDAARSTCLNDSRAAARLARTPILEPTGKRDSRGVVDAATSLSERLGVPVIVRVTSAVHATCGPDRLPAVPRRTHPEACGLDRDAAHGLTKLGRHQRQRLVTLPAVQAEVDAGAYTDRACGGMCGAGVIAVGSAAPHVAETDQCVIAVRSAWPLPRQVIDFARRHTRVLVAEEPLPFLEESVRLQAAAPSRVIGRLTGHLPPEGSLTRELLRRAWTAAPGRWTTIERKSGRTPPPARYDATYQALSRLGREGVFIAADVGSSVRLCYPPYSAARVALSLGSAVAVASGAARLGRPAVGVIGDYGLLHSGLETLLEARTRNVPVLAVVLANGVQAQTGGQPVAAVDLERLTKAFDIEVVDEWSFDDLDAEATHARLRKLLDGTLPAVVLVRDAVR